jgi:predicted transcriptional regulator
MGEEMTTEAATGTDEELIGITAGIVVAYAKGNSIPASKLPDLLNSVHEAISRLVSGPKPEPKRRPTPPVPIKKTVSPDFIISLEDGRPYKMLKRHLTKCGLTPNQYREKWGLPADYPMVAPNYAKRRSDIAFKAGLGRVGNAGG